MAKRPASLRIRPLLLERFSGPLHRRLYLALREQILRGDFQRGDRLPSSRVLAKSLGISRNTVLGAYDKLAEGEYVVAKVGFGTRVVTTFPQLPLAAAGTTKGAKLSRKVAEILGQSRYPLKHAVFHDDDGNTLYLYDPSP